MRRVRSQVHIITPEALSLMYSRGRSVPTYAGESCTYWTKLTSLRFIHRDDMEAEG
jgi:hypothetical protein